MVPPSGVRQSAARAVGDELTRDAVIGVALGIADSEGLENVTIRRLAQHFSVTPMALYWHVKNKEELLAAMGDKVFEGLRLPPSFVLPWDQEYRELLDALLAALRAHPGAVRLAGERVLRCDAGRVLTERALALLRGAGLTIQASSDVARTSLQTMMMLVSDQPGIELGTPRENWEQMLAAKAAAIAALPADRFPNLVECGPALVNCEDESVYYRDGVGLFMAGVKAQVAQSAG